MKLPLFNVSKQGFCTCLPKYNLNTYLGRCGHACVYCYAVKFPSFAGKITPRVGLLEKIEQMAAKTQPKLPVMLSDCTDPYQPLEKRYKITRKCIETLSKYGFPLLIVTKSNMVVRDIDVFKSTPSVVSFTITTLNDDVASFWEPNAPSPKLRINALRTLAHEGVTVTARIDPVIPGVNDDEEEFKMLVEALSSVGVKQITVSTLKPVKGFFKRLKKLDYELYKRLYRVYSRGRWILGYKYLQDYVRRAMIMRFRKIVLEHGLEFSSCREGFPELNTKVCDGSAYCRGLLDGFIG